MNNCTIRKIIITCEHASNSIPDEYQPLFSSAGSILSTHRGYDIGAAELAKCLSDVLAAPLFTARHSRLLADTNRHPGNRSVFSKFTRSLDDDQKQHILKTYHAPYRSDVERRIQNEIENSGRVLHLSVHSFTPVLNGVVRSADIGFLYDPKRSAEKQVAAVLMENFKDHLKGLKYRRNYPYLGVSDSLTTALRKKFPDNCYAGIEFEINQRLALGNLPDWTAFKDNFAKTVRTALTGTACA